VDDNIENFSCPLEVFRLARHACASNLPVVGGSLQVLRLLPPLNLIAMILLEVALSTIN